MATSHTMTHEVGHNMGAGHSDKMADASNCGPQYYDYSSGYYFYVGSTGYYTIMAYNADGYGNYYTSAPYFSSPDYFYKGVAVGTAVNDNTRTLRLNYQSVVDNRRPPFVSAGIGEGFEAEEYVWLTDGTYPWSRVTDVKTDGVDSSRSCEMSGKTTSWAETKVRGPATLTFKVRLRTYGGRFNVLTNGVASYSYGGSLPRLSGNTWKSASVAIPAGEHTVRLAYTHPAQGYATGGNGAWVDQLSFAGGTPVRDEPTETETTPVPVPYTWLASYYPTASTLDNEQIASQKGANGYFVWESYVAGLDPTDALSVFRVLIDMVDGQPVLSYEPVLSAEETAKRLYTTYGRTSLETEPWQKVSPGREGDYKFFKMTVELR